MLENQFNKNHRKDHRNSPSNPNNFTQNYHKSKQRNGSNNLLEHINEELHFQNEMSRDKSKIVSKIKREKLTKATLDPKSTVDYSSPQKKVERKTFDNVSSKGKLQNYETNKVKSGEEPKNPRISATYQLGAASVPNIVHNEEDKSRDGRRSIPQTVSMFNKNESFGKITSNSFDFNLKN